jgi:CheY-like chemotaxis protein
VATILVIDDLQTQRDLFASVLLPAGHTVVEARDGEAGLTLARTHKPDLIVVDTPTSNMFAQRLRADPRTADIRVMFFNMARIIASIDGGVTCGHQAQHLLATPPEPEEILRLVELALVAVTTVASPEANDMAGSAPPEQLDIARAETSRSQTRDRPRTARPLDLTHTPFLPLILVAEDNEVNQIVATRMLRRRGYRHEVAINGGEALRTLKSHRYDAVLMDNQMPEMSGNEVTRALRQWEHQKIRTPVIAMTAHVMGEDREKCFAAGMDDYLAKPLLPGELDRVLARWAPRTSAEAQAPRSFAR